MSKTVEKDLLSLLPSATLPLPRELVEVAASLLSQSRSKASSLKQDEEIARSYVCANIACERLKNKLNLPSIKPRPPVAPKTYKKVYAYLDSALSIGTPRKARQTGTPNGKDDPSTPSKQRIQSQNGTPSKTPSRMASARTPTTATPSAKRKHAEVDDDSGLPAWSMTAIRSICKTLKIAHVASNVFVGVASIAAHIREQQKAAAETPAKRRSRKSDGALKISQVVKDFSDVHVPALIVSVTMLTVSRLQGALETSEYIRQRDTAISAVAKTAPKEDQQSQKELLATIDAMLGEAAAWLELEWYDNLPEPDTGDSEGASEEDDETEDGGRDDDADELPVRSLEVPSRGSGSMMTSATDWLSEDKCADYRIWKADIMRRIEKVLKSG